MDDQKPTRREFCTTAVSFVAIGTLLESCGGSPTSPSNIPALSTITASVANNAISLTFDAGSPLASVGSAALVQTSDREIFLWPASAQDTFNAMTAICTHEACTVERYQSGTFTCPCHGSQYNTSGAVVKGPAPASLRRFNTSFANNVLTISLELYARSARRYENAAVVLRDSPNLLFMLQPAHASTRLSACGSLGRAGDARGRSLMCLAQDHSGVYPADGHAERRAAVRRELRAVPRRHRRRRSRRRSEGGHPPRGHRSRIWRG